MNLKVGILVDHGCRDGVANGRSNEVEVRLKSCGCGVRCMCGYRKRDLGRTRLDLGKMRTSTLKITFLGTITLVQSYTDSVMKILSG